MADTPAQHPRISHEEREYIEASLGQSASLDRRRLATPWRQILTSGDEEYRDNNDDDDDDDDDDSPRLGDSAGPLGLQLGQLHPQPAAAHLPLQCPQVDLDHSDLS